MTPTTWQFWALLSAAFAALTAIFAKVGVENVNSDFATFVRTIVILLALASILGVTGHWQPFGSLSLKAIFSWCYRVWRPARRGYVISALFKPVTRLGSPPLIN